MKIDKTQEFTVEFGSADQMTKSLQVFDKNGIKWKDGKSALSEYRPPSYGDYLHFNHDKSTLLGFRSSAIAVNYTPEEFHAKYGDVMDAPKYPFELVGGGIQSNGRYFKSISKDKAMVLDSVPLFICDTPLPVINQVREVIAILDLDYPFTCKDGSRWRNAWVEVDPPEQKMVTRLMTAPEIVALGNIWIKFPNGNGRRFHEILQLEDSGELSFCGRLISVLTYAKSHDATEWLPFTVTEPAK